MTIDIHNFISSHTNEISLIYFLLLNPGDNRFEDLLA